jgi:hypothetical protein
MRPFEILLELNIINLPDLEGFVARMAERVSNPTSQAWFKARLRKYLINHDPSAAQITTLTPNAPSWMVQRLTDKSPLHRFQPSPEITTYAAHIADWLNSLSIYVEHPEAKDENLRREAAQLLRKLDRVSIEQAHDHAERWFSKLNATVQTTTTSKDMRLVLKTDKGYWFELLTQDALKEEGAKMGHCVGGGGYAVGPGSETRIFSLRDTKNEPHVTIETKSGEIRQVKGKQNQPPVPRYASSLCDFLNELGLPSDGAAEGDLQRCGLHWDIESKRYGTIRDLGTVVATLAPGVEIIHEPGEDQSYHLWREGSLVDFSTEETAAGYVLKSIRCSLEPGEMREKALELTAAYLNNAGIAFSIRFSYATTALDYDAKQKKWGTPITLAVPYGKIGDTDVTTYTNKIDISVFHFAQPEHTFDLFLNTSGSVSSNRANKDDAPIIIEFLNGMTPIPKQATLADIGVFRAKEGFCGFEPERLQMQAVGGLWADPEMRFYDEHGSPIVLLDALLRGARVPAAWVPLLRANAAPLVEFIRRVRKNAIADDKEIFHKINIGYDSRRGFHVLTALKPLWEHEGYQIVPLSTTKCAVMDESGRELLRLFKNNKMYYVSMIIIGNREITPDETPALYFLRNEMSEVRSAMMAVGTWNKSGKAIISWPDSYALAMMGLAVRDGGLVNFYEANPSKKILTTDDGTWSEQRFAPYDHMFNHGYIGGRRFSLSKDKNYCAVPLGCGI